MSRRVQSGAALAFAASILAARPAHAEPPRTLAALPDASIERAQTPPGGVASGERVKGIWVGAPQSLAAKPSSSSSGGRGPTPAVVVAAAPLSVEVARGPNATITLGVGDLDPKADACIRRSRDGSAWSLPEASSAVLLERQATQVVLAPNDTAREITADNVWMVRAERLVEGEGDRAALEQVDAWVDLRSGGAREVGRRTVELALVRRFAGGLSIWGAQQDKRVMFVVRPPKAKLVSEGAAPAPVLVLATGEGQRGYCGHRTVMMSVDAAGQSATETIAGEASVPLEEPGPADGKIAPTFNGRAFRLTLTETWSNGEPSPAIGASFGWAGPLRHDGQQLAAPQPTRPQRIRMR